MQVVQVTDDVHVVTGTNVNWALVTEGRAVTVVDAGYPNDGAALLASLAAIGRTPGDVVAIALTHAHLDHMGGIPHLLAEHPAPVLTGAVEVAHAHRDVLEQISPAQMLRQCRHPRGVRWVAQTLRAALPHVSMAVPEAVAVPDGVALDVPGGLVPVATPGHTSGHTAFLAPRSGVVLTGDALVTDHPLLTGPPRPRLLPSVFSEDDDEVLASLATLGALPADTIVPGHGPVWSGPVAEAVEAVSRSCGR